MYLSSQHASFLTRMRELAHLTVPFYLPEEGDDDASDYDSPWQSLGARVVNGLSSKLLQVMFPSEIPFFRYEPSQAMIQRLSEQMEQAGQGNVDVDSMVDEMLTDREFVIHSEMSRMGLNPVLSSTLFGLVMTGNKVLNIPREGKPKSFKIDQYVISRDGDGVLAELIIKETIDKRSLIARGVDAESLSTSSASSGSTKTRTEQADLYTVVILSDDGKKHIEFQQLANGTIVREAVEYPLESTPWITPRYFRMDGFDLGRGPVEMYQGDLRTLEHLSQALTEGSLALSKILFLLRPGGVSVEDFNRAQNLDAIEGEDGDVAVVQLNKANDLSVAKAHLDSLAQSLSFSFLLNSAIQRDAERVTAEEIRYMAEQLENELGGIYSTLTLELQLPVLRAVVARLEKKNLIEKYSDDSDSEPVIVAGFDGLGRSQKARRLELFMQSIQNIPDAQGYIHTDRILSDLARSQGLQTKYIKSTEEMQAEAQAAQQQQMQQTVLDKGVGPGISALAAAEQNEQG